MAVAPTTPKTDEHVVALARAARDAATKLAKGCRFSITTYEETFRTYYDYCSWQMADIEALRGATIALLAEAPDAGDGIVFVEHVRLFMDWIELVKVSHMQGTLAHYQDLAIAWNVFQPKEPIPVDVHAKSSYDDEVPDAGPDGGALVWQHCSNGACLVVPRKDKPGR